MPNHDLPFSQRIRSIHYALMDPIQLLMQRNKNGTAKIPMGVFELQGKINEIKHERLQFGRQSIGSFSGYRTAKGRSSHCSVVL
jgi:hypothetical protein